MREIHENHRNSLKKVKIHENPATHPLTNDKKELSARRARVDTLFDPTLSGMALSGMALSSTYQEFSLSGIWQPTRTEQLASLHGNDLRHIINRATLSNLAMSQLKNTIYQTVEFELSSSCTVHVSARYIYVVMGGVVEGGRS